MDLMEGPGEQKSARDLLERRSHRWVSMEKQVYFRMCENSLDRPSSSIHRRLEPALNAGTLECLDLNSSAVLAVQFLTSEQRTNYSGT